MEHFRIHPGHSRNNSGEHVQIHAVETDIGEKTVEDLRNELHQLEQHLSHIERDLGQRLALRQDTSDFAISKLAGVRTAILARIKAIRNK